VCNVEGREIIEFYERNVFEILNGKYCNVLGGSIRDGSLFPFQKVNTLQLNTVSNSSKYTSNLYGLGT
jgi:hypothetical protein